MTESAAAMGYVALAFVCAVLCNVPAIIRKWRKQ